MADTKGDGITPIYMGSTAFKFCLIKFSQDHPHIHGEHIVSVDRLLTDRGSPPYTWGALLARGLNKTTIRITPIYMGSTFKVIDHVG